MGGRAGQHDRASTRTRVLVALAVVAQIAAFAALVVAPAPRASAGPPANIIGYVPLPSDDLQGALEAINPLADATLDFTVGITNAGNGSVMYYDHWEDGYEADIANPVQSTTEVWGDGNAGNGDASTRCSTCAGDLLTPGDVFVLRNAITTPRNAAEIRWDGRDKIGSTRGFALTSGGWTTPLGSVLSSVVAAYDTGHYGTQFVVPVGQDTPVPASTSPPFEYTGASIMASQDGTTIQVDADANGSFELSQTVNAGEAMFVNGGLLEGAGIQSNHPVQVHLITGDVGATYESRSFTLFSTDLLTNTYIDPVGSSTANQETVVYLFNPNGSDITVTPTCTSCSGSIAVPAGTSASFTVPLGEAVRFDSGGPIFSAVGATGSQSGIDGVSLDNSSLYDWGFTLVPADVLTSQLVLGWAPGNAAVPPSDDDDDPVWATTFSATTLHVDFDGDPSTGLFAADCVGLHDLQIPVAALASTRITDPNDNDMTGARIYTCDGTAVSAAWGEDPANAPAGNPGLDAGYTVIPNTTMLVDKTSTLATDSNGDGEFSPGDTVQYETQIVDVGSLSFTNVVFDDDLPPGLTYLPGSTVYDDGSTITPVADDTSPPAATAYPLDEGGASLPDVAAGNTVFVRFRALVENPWTQPSTSIHNVASVTADQASDSDDDTIQLSIADLSLVKSETASPSFVGQNAVFHVAVHNDGPDEATGVQVTDLLPAGTTYQSHTASQGTYVPGTGVWTIGTMANGADVTIDITARVDQTSVENFSQVTQATVVDPDSQPGEGPLGPGNPPNQDDEDNAVVTVAPRADLSLNKVRQTGPDASGNTTFRVTVANAGPSTATNVVVSDYKPTGAVYVSDTPSQGTFDSSTDVWTVGSIASGANATLDVTYTLDLDGFPVTNFAEVSGVTENDPDSQPAEDALDADNAPNQDDEASVTVTLSADLSLTKTETASPLFVGDDAVFDITIDNDGPDPASSIQVGDLLPAGLLYVSDTPSQGSYVPGTGVWSVGTLASGGSATLQITARVMVEGTLTNTAEVSASGAPDPDSTPGNGDATEDDQGSDSVTTTGGSIGDTVFFDVDHDGTQGPGEPGLAGVVVTVVDPGVNGTLGDGDDVTLPPVTTDASGQWTVSGLGPGPFRVTVDTTTLPGGITVPTADLDGPGSANTADVPLSSGQSRTDVDFGYTGTASVGDTIYLDLDGDGLPESGEGIPNVTVHVTWAGFDDTLGNGDDIGYTSTTNGAGQWAVSDLPTGVFRVSVDQATLPPGVVNTIDPDGSNDSQSLLTLVAGENDPNQDFGYLGTGLIGRVIFRDDDASGVSGNGEGIPNVDVAVVWDGFDATFGTADDHLYDARTDASGAYLVGNLPAGGFRVDVVQSTLPAGASNTVDPDGANDSTSQLTLAVAEQNLEQNFGYVLPAEVVPPPAPPATPVTGTLPFTGASMAGRATLLGLMLLVTGLALALAARPGGVIARMVEQRRARLA